MSAIATGFDDWDEVFRQGSLSALLSPIAPPQSSPTQPVPQGISSASSVSKSQIAPESTRHRPELAPPATQHYMVPLLEVHTQFEELLAHDLALFKTESSIELADIARLNKEKNEALRQYAEEVSKRHTWGVWGSVAEYLTTAASMVVGFSLFSMAPWAGALLMASGVLGLSNRILQETGGYQTIVSWFTQSAEWQKSIAQKIEMGALYLSMGLGLAGGGLAVYSMGFAAVGAELGRKHLAAKVAATIQLASSAVGATAHLNKVASEKRMGDLQSEAHILEAQTETIKLEISMQSQDARNMIEAAQALTQEMHEAIASSVMQL
ncbi:MAG: hypothetical protein HY861_02540 [Chlamydiia bacterium]|nr:hypothetical protein [Chlamydiia bacterium]